MMTSHVRLAGSVLTLLLLLATTGQSGPLEGAQRGNFRLPGGGLGQRDITLTFKGGERASVILKGDHEPVVDIMIEVFDEANRLITKDDGRGDYAAVIWYPSVTGKYTIRFTNPQKAYNECYLAIR